MLAAKCRGAALIAAAVGCVWIAGGANSQQRQKAPAAPDIDHVSDANFPNIFAALQPPSGEPWKSIPWHVSIVEAARQAEKEGKPILLWQADGWPLGCG